MALCVTSVDEASPAQALGLGAGCTLLAIDGHPLRDALDYQFYTTPTRFTLELCQDGQRRTLQVEKGEYEPFGCNFQTYLGDEKHSCANHCMFCFIDQLPPGMREPLYFKDDDERLSFLFGNYITLTNLTDREIDRILEMHISPIFVSVHTTNPELRVRMLANKRGGETLQYLPKLAAGGIELNCQLVLCRGINDGAELRRTLDDLLALRPQVGSIAVVPAGVTAYRQGLYKLQAYDQATAAQTLDILEEYSRRCRAQYGRSIVYPSDEWYLTAGREVPPAEFYDDFAQLEDGVGMWRLYHDTFLEELAAYRGLVLPHGVDVVTGTLAAPLIEQSMQALMQRYPQVQVTVHPIRNEFRRQCQRDRAGHRHRHHPAMPRQAAKRTAGRARSHAAGRKRPLPRRHHTAAAGRGAGMPGHCHPHRRRRVLQSLPERAQAHPPGQTGTQRKERVTWRNRS